MKKIPAVIQLDQADADFLEELAARRKVSKSVVARVALRALQRFLAREEGGDASGRSFRALIEELSPPELGPRWEPKLGDVVTVRDHEDEGERTIVALFDQGKRPGGVTLDRTVDGIFVSWNTDSLDLLRRASPAEKAELRDRHG